MKTLTMGTTNSAKVAQLAGCLAPIGIQVVGVEDKSLLPYVEEDGATVLENARKKAVVYSKALGQRVISMDNSLFIEGLSDERQPGMHVRRINGKDASTDDELLAHGQELIASLGERGNAYWEYGVCIADPDGKSWDTVLRTPRIFTSIASSQRMPGYPLESIQIDPESGKYISEMSEEEKAHFWQKTIGSDVIKLVQSIE